MKASFVITREFLLRTYLKRWLGHWWLIAIAVALIVPGLVTDVRSGQLGVVSITALSVLGILVLRITFAWFRLSRWVNDWARKQGDTPVGYRFEPDTVTAESSTGTTTLKWTAFKKLTLHRDYTLLEFPHRAGALTLPTTQMSKELLDLLVQYFQAHGLVVKDGRKG